MSSSTIGKEKSRVSAPKNPFAGNDLRTTLDLDLQRAAEEALGDQVGAVVAIDPTTGEVLVLASKPAFDPNLFATKITATAYAGTQRRSTEAFPESCHSGSLRARLRFQDFHGSSRTGGRNAESARSRQLHG